MFETTNDFANYLSPNERVLWQGTGRRRANSASVSGWVFLGIFAAMAIIFLALIVTIPRSSSSRGDQAVFVILPIIFLAVGLGVGLPLLLMGRRATNAQYFITTSAAFIVSPATSWSGKRVAVIPLKNLQQITLAENRDGTTGSLTFGVYPQTVNARYSGGWWLDSMPAFWNIERPLDVYQLIRKQMSEA
jgi:hypothetical protein